MYGHTACILFPMLIGHRQCEFHVEFNAMWNFIWDVGLGVCVCVVEFLFLVLQRERDPVRLWDLEWDWINHSRIKNCKRKNKINGYNGCSSARLWCYTKRHEHSRSHNAFRQRAEREPLSIICTDIRRLIWLRVFAGKDTNSRNGPVRSCRIHFCHHHLDRSRTTTHKQKRE